MKRVFTARVLPILLVVLMLVGMVPAYAADVQMAETELNKLVGYYATTADPERQGAVLSSDYVKDQTKTVKLDEKAGLLSIDFGYAASVTRLELISANAATALTGDDFDVWLGTENFGKVKMFNEGNEKRSQLGKLSKQDYEVTTTVVDGHAVLNFRFFGNAAGRYLVLQLKNPSAAPDFVLEQIGRDVRVYGEIVVTNNPETMTTQLSIVPDTVTGDNGFAALPQLGDGAYEAFDTKDASLTLDMGETVAMDKIVLRAADAAAEIPADALALAVSDDGENWNYTKLFTVSQEVVDGRRELTVAMDTAKVGFLQGRYFKLTYTKAGAEAFVIVNTEQDIQVVYDPFGLPDSDPERREKYAIAVSARYFDSRLRGEYGEEAWQKSQELSVEEFILWYLDNLDNNLNYLYRWENLGESIYADGENISMALKLPAADVVDQIVVTANGNANYRLRAEDWIISYSNNDRDFTVMDPDTLSFREVVINGKMNHVIDFPEVKAKTFIAYNTYTKNYEAIPSGYAGFHVFTNAEHYAAYNKLPADARYTAAPVAVEMRTGDAVPVVSDGSRTKVLLELDAEAAVIGLNLTPKTAAAVNGADFELQAWDSTAERWEDVSFSAAGTEEHIFTLDSAVKTMSLMLTYTGAAEAADYFAENYSAYSVTVSNENPNVSLAEGLSKVGFVYNYSYLYSGWDTATQQKVWDEIAAEADPVEGYRVAKTYGLEGWVYRITAAYALDTPQLRQSLKYSWGEVKKVSRLTIAANSTRDDLRVTENDFYVAYSTTDFNTYETFTPADLTVVKSYTDGGCPMFTIDLPTTVEAQQIILYTTYSLGELSDPTATGHYYFILNPGDSNISASCIARTETVVVTATTMSADEDPMAVGKSDLLMDLGSAVAVDKIVLTPKEAAAIDADLLAVKVFDADTAAWIEPAWTVEGEAVHTIQLTDSVTTRYVLLQYMGEVTEGDYFRTVYSGFAVLLPPTGETISLNEGLTGRTYAPNASYLVSSWSAEQRQEVWAKIAAEADPVEAYRTGLANGVSIGWGYRISTRTAIDAPGPDLRGSIMVYWAEAKNLNRLYIPTDNAATNLRVTADDFYVAYSTNNFTTYETLTPADLTVTRGTTEAGYPCFTIDMPEITASHVIIYTSYSLGTLSAPPTGTSYFIVVPTQVQAAKTPVATSVTPVLTSLAAGSDPFGAESANEGKSFALDRSGRAVGFENLDGLSVDRFMILGTGTPSTNAANYKLTVSNDNSSWTEISDFSLSAEAFAGKTALIVDAALDARYVKLTYVGSSFGMFTVDNLAHNVYAFSLQTNADYSSLYEKQASFGYVDADRSAADGTADYFGESVQFTFDYNYRSIVADLGDTDTVNYIKLYDDDGQTRLAKQDLTIWVSNDNVTYTQIEDFDLRQDGRVLHLYNFEAEGRYIKLHQNHFESSNYISGSPAFDYYSTVKGELQTMMAVYEMPTLTTTVGSGDYPFGQGQWQYYKELTVEGEGDLVFVTYEELGLAALAAEGKLQADYDDLRFAAPDGSLLHYYNTGEGYYVRVKDNAVFHMWYGDPNAEAVADGTGTFQVDYGSKIYGTALGGDAHFATLPDGRVAQIAYCSVPDGKYETFLAISEDNGLTFGEPIQVSDTPTKQAQSGGILVLDDGTVMVTYMWHEKSGGYGNYLDPELTNSQVYAVTSKDLENWSEPVLVSNPDQTYNLATTSPMQASNGDLFLPIATMVDNLGGLGIYVMRSTDNGRTWEQCSPIFEDDAAFFEGGYCEPCVVELEDGTIRVFYRQGAGTDVCRLGQVTSYDYGETWGKPEQSEFYATATQPVTFKLDDGRILLMWAGHNGTSVKSYQRMPVTVAYTDDNGETWHGYQEVSGRSLINNPFGYPMALQPDFVYAPDGSLTYAIWVRGTIYAPDGMWVTIHMDDFDRWMEENTGAFDDFEQASSVKGNYWYEMGPRVGVSSEESVSGSKSLRIADNSTIDTAFAARNFMGTTRGELTVSFKYTSAASGLRLALYECEPVHVGDYGGMFALDVAGDGTLSWVGADEALTDTGMKLQLDQWYELTMKFDVEAGTMDVYVDGTKVAAAGCMEQQSIIAYFAAYSTGLAESGTEFWLDDLIVIDSEDAGLALTAVSEEKVPAEKINEVKIAGTSMTLGNDLALNFMLPVTDVTGEDWYAEIVHGDKVTVIEQAEWATSGNYVRIAYNGLAAKQMVDEVTITIYDADGNELTKKTDSARAYAMRMFGKSGAAFDTVLADMLNYGAAAQLQFNYKTDDLANSLMTEEQKAKATESIELSDIRKTASGYQGATLSLENNIVLNFFYSADFVGKTATVSYTDHYGVAHEYEAEVVASGSMGKVSVDKLVISDCSVAITVTIDGEAVVDSVESYCARMTTLALREPLMKFAASARDYFGK